MRDEEGEKKTTPSSGFFTTERVRGEWAIIQNIYNNIYIYFSVIKLAENHQDSDPWSFDIPRALIHNQAG